MLQVSDYSGVYDSIMQFNKNKSVSVHQWYPFVEGYSKEFIESVLDELEYNPGNVLEPFSGSGTTALELQFKGIKCTSFEVSPFMHLLSSVKLCNSYRLDLLNKILVEVKLNLATAPVNIRAIQPIPFGDTVVRSDRNKKWNFNDETLDGILDIKYAISKIKDSTYKNLFRVALASILIEVSNLFRNGKCLSYKNKWHERPQLKREEVHSIFLSKVEDIILKDIEVLEDKFKKLSVANSDTLYLGDVRSTIQLVPSSSIDLIITSPPYLNSRDYTDIYMLELKVLDLVSNHQDLQLLRKRTLRSHVQVKHGELPIVDSNTLRKYIKNIENKNVISWNNGLLGMIKGYFLDMDKLFSEFERVIKDKRIYFNVANSAYFGQEIKVDEIVCEIASNYGFKAKEIRIARNLKASSQQSESIGSLRESVILLES